MDYTIDPMTSYKTAQLVVTYEELYHVPESERTTYYFGDLGLHVFKYGAPKDTVLTVYEKALTAVRLDNDTFQQSEDFIYRGGIIARMQDCMLDEDTRLRDVLDGWGTHGPTVLIHEDAPDCPCPLEHLTALTPYGREDFAALLDARVREVRCGTDAIEVVLSGAAPEELVRFSNAYDAFMEAERAMGPVMG